MATRTCRVDMISGDEAKSIHSVATWDTRNSDSGHKGEEHGGKGLRLFQGANRCRRDKEKDSVGGHIPPKPGMWVRMNTSV